MNSLHGKTALISGGSRGVGFATAAALAKRGCNVVITARTKARLTQSCQKLIDTGAHAAYVVGDVGNWDDAQKMVQAAIDNFGGLDILINNAGVSMRGEFADLSPQMCEQVISTNLTGCVLLAKAAIAPIIKSKGHIVFISSIAGLLGLPGASIYCATKGALTGLSDSMRLELLPQGVHVGVVHLGFTQNDPDKRILDADGKGVLPDRPAHHTQDYAAQLIVRMIEKRKRKLIMTPVGNLGAIVNRLAPGLVEKVILFAKSRQWGSFKKFS